MTDPWTGEPNLAELRRAYHLIESKDPGAIPMLENLVSVGSVMAMVYLGTAFQKGLNGRPDRVEAEKWYRRAIETNRGGSYLAAFNLGSAYFRDGNYEAAKKMYIIGATVGHLPSMYWLARTHLEDSTESSNLDEIRQLLEKAAAGGHLHAQRKLAIVLMRQGIMSPSFFRGLWMFLNLGPRAFSVALHNPSSELLK